MRLFIAVNLPNKVKAEFDRLKELINPNTARIKWVTSYHLTLKFLGETAEQLLPRIKAMLGKVRFKHFRAETSSIGLFPSPAYVRVVWVGVEPKQPFIELKKEIDQSLAKLGFKPEKDFVPHITLCRVKALFNKKEFSKAVQRIKIPKLTFDVRSFDLMQSILSPKGPTYKTIAVFSASPSQVF